MWYFWGNCLESVWIIGCYNAIKANILQWYYVSFSGSKNGDIRCCKLVFEGYYWDENCVGYVHLQFRSTLSLVVLPCFLCRHLNLLFFTISLISEIFEWSWGWFEQSCGKCLFLRVFLQPAYWFLYLVDVAAFSFGTMEVGTKWLDQGQVS